ncbi:MAG: diguanylate cyclase, partial [Gammaproteobacteria bacterium HGW-Gammaproteobacteria-7]
MHPHSADVFVDAYLARHAGPSVASPRPAWQKPWLLALLAAAISLLAGVLWRSLDLPAGPALVLPGMAVAGALPVYLCARLLHQRKRLTHARGEVALLRQLCSLWAQSEGACLKELDAHGRLLAMSERGRQLMDVCDFDALRGSDWLGIWPGEAAATARDAFARALAGEPARFSGFCPTLAGVAKWWDVLIMPLPGAGEATSMLVLSWDVTEVRQRACQLQTTNDELTTLLEHLDDGFCRLDRSWRLVELNGRAVALLQRPRSELLGTLLWDLLPQARGAELGVALQEVMDLGIARRIETFSPQYQGWYRIHAYPHADGLYLFFSDISRDVASAQTAQAVQARLRLSQQVGLFGDWQFDLTSQRLDLSG